MLRPILAIDPGPAESAWLTLSDGRPTAFAKEPNDQVILHLRDAAPKHVVIEMIASYGMAVGAEVFETCVWIGRFMQVAQQACHRVERMRRLDVKSHLCHSSKATDANIRAALVDRFGGTEAALTGRRCAECKGRGMVGLGKKRGPCLTCTGSGWAVPRGPLYGIAADVWAALALACTASDGREAIANRSTRNPA